MSADLFTQGLRAIGNDVTRTALVRAINRLTAFTADGAYPPVDWRVAHTGVTDLDCTTYVRARGDRVRARLHHAAERLLLLRPDRVGPHVDRDGDDAAAPAGGAGPVTQFLNYAVPGVPVRVRLRPDGRGPGAHLQGVGRVQPGLRGPGLRVRPGLRVAGSRTAGPGGRPTVIAVLVIGPLVGVLLDRLLFRRIRTASPLVKLVPSLGLLVALPQLALIIAGSTPAIPPPAIVGDAQRVYLHLGSVPAQRPRAVDQRRHRRGGRRPGRCCSGSRRSDSRCGPWSRAPG